MVICVNASGGTKNSLIVDISFEEKAIGVGNFVVQGFPIANGIVSSIRVDGDGPELMWELGYKVYQAFGPLIANIMCNIGYHFIDKNIARTKIYFALLLSIAILFYMV